MLRVRKISLWFLIKIHNFSLNYYILILFFENRILNFLNLNILNIILKLLNYKLIYIYKYLLKNYDIKYYLVKMFNLFQTWHEKRGLRKGKRVEKG